TANMTRRPMARPHCRGWGGNDLSAEPPVLRGHFVLGGGGSAFEGPALQGGPHGLLVYAEVEEARAGAAPSGVEEVVLAGRFPLDAALPGSREVEGDVARVHEPVLVGPQPTDELGPSPVEVPLDTGEDVDEPRQRGLVVGDRGHLHGPVRATVG